MEQMMVQAMGFIQEIGFPIFVSFYLLHRLETKLEAIHGALVTLKVK
ncbi:YvrJ family protein [Sporosarcina aquimarina]